MKKTRRQSRALVRLKEIWRRFCKNRIALAGFIVLMCILLVVVFADVIVPYEMAEKTAPQERLQLIFFTIRTSAIATPIPIPVPVIQINSVLLTSGIIKLICFASTDKAGSATVARSPNTKPKLSTKTSLLYLANEPPTIRPIGNILVSKPTKNIACPNTTPTYPTIIFK